MNELKATLSAYSHFSIGKSLLSPKKIVRLAKELGFDTVALTDEMTISGIPEFASEAKALGIKAIVGSRLRVVREAAYRDGSKSYKPSRYEFYPKVYVKNDAGMVDLMKLLSIANDEHHFYFVPRISFDQLLLTLAKGNLIITTGDLGSAFAMTDKDFDYQFVMGHLEQAAKDNLFVELPTIDTILFDTVNQNAINSGYCTNENIIFSYPIMYESLEDADSLDVLSAITRNAKIDDKWNSVQYVKDFNFKTPQNYKDKAVSYLQHINAESFFDHAESNSNKIINQCLFVWKNREVSLPKQSDDEHKSILEAVRQGWIKRFSAEVFGHKPSKEDLPIYKERLKYELGILQSMGFERYFLMVQDLVNWSKNNNILVGCGRGSSAGSLVSYLMGITDLDPIRFELIFERFINPSRLDLPDADIDFMSERRHEVITYLENRYGTERVAGITNYTALGSSSAIRDCGRVFGLMPFDMTATTLVPKENGVPVSISEAVELVPMLQVFRDEHPIVWRHALKLEGVMRGLGKHAAGVVVSDEPIIERAVVEKRSGSLVVNWDRNSVESQGLIKMDILGLSTLDTIQYALNYLKEKGITLNLNKIKLDDEKTLALFSNGDTIGIFQFDGGSARRMLKDMAKFEPLVFNDIVATNALNRPGPLESGMAETYVKVKQREESAVYDHPDMIPILEKTMGVIIYQEQVMKVAQVLAGYTMAEADMLRKIMGKKKREEMEKQRDKFVEGCIATSSISQDQAEELFDKIDKFSGYGFNLSHSASYSIISFQCAFIKAHYPSEFYAASLTVEQDEAKLKGLAKDAVSHGITLMPPDINFSSGRFESRKIDGSIYLYAPFNKIKGLSVNGVQAILAGRKKVGKFTSKAHFLSSVHKGKVNVRVVQALDDVGAFAEIENQRPSIDPSRLKIQMELLPGLITSLIKSDRTTLVKDIAPNLNVIARSIGKTTICKSCTLVKHVHCMPSALEEVKFMVVTDCATKNEAKVSKKDATPRFMQKGSQDIVKMAMFNAGINSADGYYTALVKTAKSSKLTAEQIKLCSVFLDKEVKVINPAIIICLGSASIRHFIPDIKGNAEELCGQIHYIKELDATIVCGINPEMAFFKPHVTDLLEDVFSKVLTMI